MEIKRIVLDTIQEILKETKKPRFDWNDSLYEDTQYLSIDGRGKLGEKMAAYILREYGREVGGDDDSTDAERGYDIVSNGIKLEIKLATITVGSGMFQHENLNPQRDFQGVLFIDIAPEQVFLTAVKKENIIWTSRHADKEQTRVRELKPLHRRESGGAYKCDFTITQIQNKKIPRFNDYKTGEVETTDDFFNIYKHLEE